MSTASRAKEAEQATIAYQIALTKIGAAVIAEALNLWNRDMPINGAKYAAGAWMTKVTVLIQRRRDQARQLARAYYRLERALRTGYTVTSGPRDKATSIGLNDLRTEFRDLAGPEAPSPVAVDNPEVPVERLPEMDLDVKRQERDAVQEIRTVASALGPANLERKLDELDTEKPAAEVDEARQQAHEEAGARQAAAAERIALNGARSELWSATSRDKRAIGYIRLSRTGTPCGWCAMLISRGPVYKSKRTAETAVYGDGDLYHDNCHCYAVPVYSRTEYQTSDLYALNREYQELWPEVTKGLGGAAALSAWRRYIRSTQK